MKPVTALHNPRMYVIRQMNLCKSGKTLAMVIWFGILVRQNVAQNNRFRALGKDQRGNRL